MPLPPDPMPLLRGGRPLKAWRYVGAFGPELMLCAATVRVGPVRESWWAVWDGARLVEGGGPVAVGTAAVAVRGAIALSLAPAGDPVEVVSPHGRQYAWTRKRVAVARGRVLGRDVTLPALVDESAGYHARHTAWRWSAGAGRLAGGEAVAWNLVAGLHDAPSASERTVWIDGRAQEVPPAAFADDLGAVGDLRFAADAVRARRRNLLLVRSAYEQPFGRFAGRIAGVPGELTGHGVMERHDVRW